MYSVKTYSKTITTIVPNDRNYYEAKYFKSQNIGTRVPAGVTPSPTGP